MNTKTKGILSTLAFAIVGFQFLPYSPVGEKVWGAMPEDGSPDPDGGQLGLLIAVGVLEVLAFGLGFTLLIFGWRPARRMGVSATLALVAVAWGLVSWVPHTAMHATNGENLNRLILTEYVFHVTLILGAVTLAWFVAKSLWRIASASPGSASARVPPVPAARAGTPLTSRRV